MRWPLTRTGGYGPIGGEMATGVLADEILKPGPGRIRAMINHGGNTAVTVPDQRKIVEALRSLELLVSIDPFMTPTARLSNYSREERRVGKEFVRTCRARWAAYN